MGDFCKGTLLYAGGRRVGAPFLVKQFASYFALWQKEMLQAGWDHVVLIGEFG